MAKENIRKIVHKIAEWGTFDVTFTGGEPFMRRDLLYAGIEAVKETGMDFGINSNASLITPNDAARLKDYGVASLFLSFPSLHRETFEAITGRVGSCDNALRGYGYLAEAGLKLTANTVVTKCPANNVGDVYDTAKMLVERFKIRRFCTAPVSPGHGEHNDAIITNDETILVLEQMLRVARDFRIDIRNSRPLPICFLEDLDPELAEFDLFRGCTIGVVNGMTVDLLGNLKPCPVMPFSIANVFEHDLAAVSKAMSVFDGKDSDQLHQNAPSECHECAILDVCKGGCKTEALAMTGKINARSRFMKRPQHDAELLHRIMPDKELVTDDLVTVRPRIKWRQETDDAYVIRAESFAVLQDAELDLLRYLQSLGRFSPAEIARRHSLDPKMFNLFLNKLAKAKALGS